MTSWRTADLTGYAAGSEFDPNYSDGPHDTDHRTPEQRHRDDRRSAAIWDAAIAHDEARRRREQAA